MYFGPGSGNQAGNVALSESDQVNQIIDRMGEASSKA
jgi:hypothetical protein